MRVLLIEDNDRTRNAIKRGLRTYYAVDVASCGEEGLSLADSVQYDIILLDLNLPDIPGEQVCKKLRKRGVTVPILVLSGRVDLVDKVSLLDVGADDYVTKPFSLEEVRARIRAVMRRGVRRNTSGLLVAGDIELDPASRTVQRGDQAIMLRRKEFDLLEFFMRNNGRTLTRPMIIGHVWDNNENLWANVIDVHIKHLRDKIDRPFDSHVIKTVHGVGYKLDTAKDK